MKLLQKKILILVVSSILISAMVVMIIAFFNYNRILNDNSMQKRFNIGKNVQIFSLSGNTGVCIFISSISVSKLRLSTQTLIVL